MCAIYCAIKVKLGETKGRHQEDEWCLQTKKKRYEVGI